MPGTKIRSAADYTMGITALTIVPQHAVGAATSIPAHRGDTMRAGTGGSAARPPAT